MSKKPSWRDEAAERLADVCDLNRMRIPLDAQIDRRPVTWWQFRINGVEPSGESEKIDRMREICRIVFRDRLGSGDVFAPGTVDEAVRLAACQTSRHAVIESIRDTFERRRLYRGDVGEVEEWPREWRQDAAGRWVET